MNEDIMGLEEFEAFYDASTSTVTFVTSHFSYWFIGEDVDESDGFVNIMTGIVVIIVLAFCMIAVRMKR